MLFIGGGKVGIVLGHAYAKQMTEQEWGILNLIQNIYCREKYTSNSDFNICDSTLNVYSVEFALKMW